MFVVGGVTAEKILWSESWSCFHSFFMFFLEQLQQLHSFPHRLWLWTWEGSSKHPESRGSHPGVSKQAHKETQTATWRKVITVTVFVFCPMSNRMCPTAAPSCLVHSCTVGEPPRFAAVEGPFSGCHGKTCHCTASGFHCCGRGWLGCSGGHKQTDS